LEVVVGAVALTVNPFAIKFNQPSNQFYQSI